MPTPKYNILIIHNRYRFAGGEDSVVQNEKHLLEEHGHRVTLYEKNNTALDSCSLLQKLRLPFCTLYSFSSYKEIKKLIFDNNIDIVHVHNTLPLISFSSYYAAKKSGCSLVQTIHNFRLLCPNGLFFRDGIICQDCLQSLSCSVRHACYRGSKLQSALVAFSLWLHRRLGTFQLPDAYIVLTAFNRKMLSGLIPEAKLYLKPNFTENPISPSTEKTRDYFLFASRLDRSKGIFLLLEAFLLLPGQNLVIIGGGPEEEAVTEYIAQHHMSNVRFLGFTEHEKTLSYLYHAKALIFPSQWLEGFPVVIAESLSLGTPIIGSNIGNTASIIEDGITGLLFQYDSAEDCTNKVKYFSSHPKEALLLEQNCLETFLRKYSPSQNYQQLLSIYHHAMRRHH